jgi:hypothetical protein
MVGQVTELGAHWQGGTTDYGFDALKPLGRDVRMADVQFKSRGKM